MFDDPSSGVRVRVHRFEESWDQPHSHRWGFTTRILAGGYTNFLYGPEKWVHDSVERDDFLPAPAMVRRESVGTSYTIGDDMVHNVHMQGDTISMIVRGPSRKNKALRIDEAGNAFWKGGRAHEDHDAVEAVRTSWERIDEVLELACAKGVAR